MSETESPVWTNWEGRNAGRFRLTRYIAMRGGCAAFHAAGGEGKAGTRVEIYAGPVGASGAAAMAAFLDRAGVFAADEHPSVEKVSETGTIAGRPFMAIEGPGGSILGEELDEVRRLPVEGRLRVVLQIGQALEWIHRRGYAYLSLSPDMIAWGPDATPRLLGIQFCHSLSAVYTENNEAVANPLSAPELELAHREVDQRADCYSLGMFLDLLLNMAGKPHLKKPDWEGDLIEKVATIYERLADPDPLSRYVCIGDPCRALEFILNEGPVERFQAEEQGESIEEETTAALAAAYTGYYRGFLPAAQFFFRYTYPFFGLGIAVWCVFSQLYYSAIAVATGVLFVPLAALAAEDVRSGFRLLRVSSRLLMALSAVRSAILVLAALGIFGWFVHIGWLDLLVVGAGGAAITIALYRTLLILPLKLRRKRMVEKSREALSRGRRTGIPEENLCAIALQVSGGRWRQFHMELFDYEVYLRIAEKLAVYRSGEYAAPRLSLYDRLYRLLEGATARLQYRATMRQAQNLERELPEPTAKPEPEPLTPLPRPRAAESFSSFRRRPLELEQNDRYRVPSGLRRVTKSLASASGSAIFLAAALPIAQARGLLPFSIPAEVRTILEAYYSWGYGNTLWAFAIGGFLTKVGAGGRPTATLMALVGAIFLLFTKPVVVAVGDAAFTAEHAVFTGWALLIIAVGTGRMARSFLGGGGLLPFR